MKYAIVGSLTALVAGAGLALADPPAELLHPPRPLSAPPADATMAEPAVLPGGRPGLRGPGRPLAMPAPACGARRRPVPLLGRGRLPALVVEGKPLPDPPDQRDRSVRRGSGDSGTVPSPGATTWTARTTSRRGITVGGWITDYQGFGLEGSFFMLESRNRSFNAAGTGDTGTQVLALPFFNVLTGRQAALPIAFPGFESGSVSGSTDGHVRATPAGFVGADFHFICNLCCTPEYRVDFLFGYRTCR